MSIRNKEEAFSRLAEKRLDEIKKRFKLFRNLANPYNYTFTPQKLQAIVDALNKEVKLVQDAYAPFIKDEKGETQLKKATEKIVSNAKEGVKEIDSKNESKPTVTPTLIIETDDSEVPDFLKRKSG